MNVLMYSQIAEKLRAAEHILLLTDERLDGDTLGSTMGLYHSLSAAHKRVDVFSPKPLPSTFEFLPKIDVIRRDFEVFKQPSIDLVVVCDSSDGAFLDGVLAHMTRKVPLISFDHHGTNPRYATINCIEPKAASTADLIFRFLRASHFPITRDAAQCILTGICTDTDVFFTKNTTAAAVEASVELTKLGARLHDIVRHTMMNKSETSLKLWGLALERLFYDETFDGIATAITQEDIGRYDATPEDLEGISNFLNAILDESHEVVVVYRETEDGHVKGSARSRGRDVAAQAERLYGGGGHKLAAGFKIKNSHLEQRGEKWTIVPNQQKTTG